MGTGVQRLLIHAASFAFFSLLVPVVSAEPEPFSNVGILQLQVSAPSSLILTPQLKIERKSAPATEREEEGKVDGPTQRAIETSGPTDLAASLAFQPKRTSARAAAMSTIAVETGTTTWKAIGPFPIPNGQTTDRVDPVSGRVTAIAIDPTDPNVAYVGTAQGGLYQTLDGGTTWTQMMDNAVAGPIGTPLAIGSVAVNPSDAQVVFVGTGEGNNNFDGAFGTGFYIITGAKTGTPTLSGPFNSGASGHDIFAGRSIAAIAVDPTNGNNVFCGTTFGFRGFYSTDESPIRPPRGLYRSSNALSSSPTWTRIPVGGGANSIVTSVVVDPGDPNHVIVAVQGQTTDEGPGIYVSNDALSSTPTFMLTQPTPLNSFVKLAIERSGNPAVVTVLAASGESNSDTNDGKLYKSTDGGATWTEMTGARGFAGGQGFYNVAVAIDPVDTNKVYLGGAPPARYWGVDATFQYSTDGGASFTPSVTGLHPDSHAIAIAPSNSSIIYTGNDGGIWKSTDAGHTWVSLNNSTLSATQFSDLAVHPADRNLSIAGTQDNGTLILHPDGTFERVDYGDGGYSLIDQSASDTTATVFYHTYYNRAGALVGSARMLKLDCAREGEWTFHGGYQGPLDSTTYCDGSSDTFDTSALTDNVNFYAPQALGPGTPNTWYFGTDKLYRSNDRADTLMLASQVLDPDLSDPTKGTPISALAISPQDDNVRLVGLNNGKVFATTNGGAMLVQITGTGATNGPATTPSIHVSRIAIDPQNKSTAYVVFSGYGTASAPVAHVWKTTNLDALNSTPAGAVIFTPASSGLPDVSANAIAIDPMNSSYIYLGTDAGVFSSRDGGTTWSAYGSGLPNVAVFGLQLQSQFRVLRAATHGRGMYEIGVETPAAPPILMPTPTPTPIVTPTPVLSPTPAPTATATPTPTPTATSTPTATATPTPDPTPAARALNISTRVEVGSGDNRAIGGFIITGDVSKRVIVRALGSSLAASGVSGALADPVLELYASDGTLIARNDNWRDTDSAQITATGLAPNDDAEAAIIAKLSPGNYTMVVSGANDATGVALVEVYDLEPDSASSRFANISTRGVVQAGSSVIIGGFILDGDDGADVVIRGLGPSLAQNGLANVMDDPVLELRDADGALIATNDNWQDEADGAAAIEVAGLALSDPHEAAIAAHLNAGPYTAILAGQNAGSGTGIVEIYTLQ